MIRRCIFQLLISSIATHMSWFTDVNLRRWGVLILKLSV